MTLVLAPRLNANEDELNVVSVSVSEGDRVQRGDEICILESTKVTVAVEAPQDGFISNIKILAGGRVDVGAPICTLSETVPDAVPTEPAAVSTPAFRATDKARALAEAHGIDLSGLAQDGNIIRLRDVQRVLQNTQSALAQPPVFRAEPLPFSPSSGLVIFGAGGHARAVIDLVRSARPDLQIVAAVDDAPDAPEDVLGVPVVGASILLGALRERGLALAALGTGSIARNAHREALYDTLTGLGFELPTLVHARASVEPSAVLGQGGQIFAGAVVGSCVRLGANVIINSGAIVSHDCTIGDHAHITPGAILAGGVQVGAEAVVGMGVTIYLGVEIGAGARIANGCHITQDVPAGAIVRL